MTRIVLLATLALLAGCYAPPPDFRVDMVFDFGLSSCSDLAALLSDPANCGFCGNVCGGGEACCAGVCVTLDQRDRCGGCQVVCGGGADCCQGGGGELSCATLASDDANCGACGVVCAAGEACGDGACHRLDTRTDCGAIGRACGPGQECCDGGGGFDCLGVTSDPANCGACGHVCADGQKCSDGLCAAIVFGP